MRQNLRTAKNRMKRENVNYREEILNAINDTNFKEIEDISRSKLLDNKHCVYSDLSKKAFLKDMYYSSELPCNIIKLILNNRVASYRINFIYSQNKYCVDASYNRNYRHYELGGLSVDLNIRDSFEKNLKIHCLGTGIDAYKLKFTKQIVRIYTFLKKGNTLKALPVYIIRKRQNRRIEKKFNEELKRNLGKD